MTEPAAAPGMQPHRKKISAEKRAAIRELYATTNMTAVAIAERHKVGAATVAHICRDLPRHATPKQDAWYSTTRGRKPRPLCDRCAAGEHRASDHAEMGCLRVVRDYVCGCLHGATFDVLAPLSDGKRVEITVNLAKAAAHAAKKRQRREVAA